MAGLEGDWMPCLTAISECEEAFNTSFGVPPESKPAGKWFQLWNVGIDPAWHGR